MSLLEWKSEYSVGIASMDDEHREMIASINSAYDRLGKASKPEAIAAGLDAIFSTIAGHFASEERVMRDAGYDEYDDHKEDHEHLLDQVRGLIDDYASDPVRGAPLLEDRLSDWFAKHFATFDARLHGRLGPH